MNVREAALRVSGGLAVLSAFWALVLALTGGFTIRLFGLALRSHDTRRPLLLCVVACAVFWLTGGRAPLTTWMVGLWARTTYAWNRFLSVWRTGYVHHVLAAAVVLGLLVAGMLRMSTAAGGSDSYGYLSEAELFLDGRVAIEQRWVQDVPWPNAQWGFAPLGYTPSRPTTFRLGGFAPPAQDRWAIVPSYSPGLPLLMALGKSVSGACGPFWIVPVAGALLLLSTYLIGVRLGSRTLGLLAVPLLATSPPFLLLHMVNMTDVPAAACLALACWCMLGSTMRSAVGAGLALGLMLLIRPNLVPLVPVFLLWLVWQVARDRVERKHHMWRGAIVLAGIGVASLVTSAIYWAAYGSPFESGYGPAGPFFSLSHIVPNIRNYVRWFSEVQTPLAFLGVIAVALPVRALWPDVTDRSALVMFALLSAVVTAEFLVYLVFDNSSYLRFFLVCYPFIMLGLASVTLVIGRLHRVIGPVIATALVIGLCVNNSRISHEWRVFQQGLIEAKYADVADHVRRATPENSVVLAMNHSGSIRYYAGRVTMRWDNLQADWLDRAVAWMGERGVRTYALLDDFEQAEAVKHFKRQNQKLVTVLEGPPVFRFGNKLFYDLNVAPGTHIDTMNLPVIDVPPKCWTPAEPPGLVWK